MNIEIAILFPEMWELSQLHRESRFRSQNVEG